MVWYLKYYLRNYLRKTIKPIPQTIALKWYNRLKILYFIFALNSLIIGYNLYKNNHDLIKNNDLTYAHYYARSSGMKTAKIITYDNGFKNEDFNHKEYSKVYKKLCEEQRNSLVGKDILKITTRLCEARKSFKPIIFHHFSKFNANFRFYSKERKLPLNILHETDRQARKLSEHLDYLKGIQSKFGNFKRMEFINSISDYLSKPQQFFFKSKNYTLKDWRIKMSRESQNFQIHEYTDLGPDLYVARFIVSLEGKILFRGDKNWISSYSLLPKKKDLRLQLMKIDASGMELFFEGIMNFVGLKHLEELKLCNSPYICDWCIAKLAHSFRQSTKLHTIDLTGCPLVTDRGISSLIQVKSLRKLIIKDTDASRSEFIDLFVILFNELAPYCEIIKC